MRLAVVSHSLVHIRQQKFMAQVAALGHELLCIAPRFWGNQYTRDYSEQTGEGSFQVRALLGEAETLVYTPYSFRLRGLGELLSELKPGWVYCQQEPGSQLLAQCIELKPALRFRLACFTWENIALKPDAASQLNACELVVCGNDAAERLVKAASPAPTTILPQVGVDTAHFVARPGVLRNIPVAYIGRLAPEKGLEQLRMAYPKAHFLEWQPWERLPWWYSQVQVVVCYSQDNVIQWKEQAMPYVLVEAIASGCVGVASDAGSIPFWNRVYAGENPAVKIVSQTSITALRTAIEQWLDMDTISRNRVVSHGREWVMENLGAITIARKLIEAFDASA